jgi:hypothetical protein
MLTLARLLRAATALALTSAATVAISLTLTPTLRAQQDHVITLDFETAGQFTGNFRVLSAIGGGTAAQTTSGGNGFFRQDVASGAQAATYLFDTTPGDTTRETESAFDVSAGLTITFDARTNNSNGSFAIVFADPANLNKNVTALFNILSSANGTDQLRFFKNGTPSTSAIGTQVGSTVAPSTNPEPNNTWYPVTITLSVTGTTPTLTLTAAGSTTIATSAFAAGDFDWTKTLVILRLFDPVQGSGSTVDVDNLVIRSRWAPRPAAEVNVAPVLPTIPTQAAEAGKPFSVNSAATDANTPPQALSYELLNPPAGASISSAGLITWTPTIAQGGATYTLTVRVTDAGAPPLSATASFDVVVSEYVPEPNVAPVLPSQPDRTVTVNDWTTGGVLTVNNAATDANLPPQNLTYELLNPPAGATISQSGVITWTPTAEQANATYTITTRVTDDGSPALSATNAFQVTVLPNTGFNSTYDFAAASQFTGNFRTLAALGGGSAGHSSNEGGMLRVDANTSSGNTYVGWLFDTTPTNTTLETQSTFDTASPVRVAFDLRAVTSDSNVAVIFADAENLNNNVAAAFNVRTGADTVRFFRNAARNTAGTTLSLGTQVGTTVNVASAAEPGSGAAFTNLQFTLSRDGSTPTLAVHAAGADPVAYTFHKGTLNWARTVIILRVVDAGGNVANTHVDLDNLAFSASGGPLSPITANTAPRFEAVPSRTIPAGRLLVVANPAVDFDVPRQAVTYALTQAPAGAIIDSEGTILWRPTAADVSATPYTFTTTATDNGSPAQTASNSFQVVVTAAQNLGAFTSDLDFLTSGQFDAAYRSVTDLGGGPRGQVGARLVVDATSNGGNQNQAWLLDTTPADSTAATQTAFPTTSPLTVSFTTRVAFAGADASVGIVFADSRNAANNVSALLNLRHDAEQLRFFRDGSFTQRSLSNGTQVGSSVNLLTAAEPGYVEYLPVTVTLSASGTTPTLTVRLGDADPVTSSFVAGDIDWSTTLVLLRVNDPNVGRNTAVEFNNLLVAGPSPVAAAAPPLAPAPASPGDNLLTVNPGFEAVSFSTGENVTASFSGWETFKYQTFDGSGAQVINGSVGAGTTTESTRAFYINWGGWLQTARASRAAVTPGQTLEFSYDQRSLLRNFPNEKLGTLRFLEFFDSAGLRIKQVWGADSDYKVQYDGPNATGVWETFTLRATVPPGAASVGVRLDAPLGNYNSEQANYVRDRHVVFDNVRLTVVPETLDRLAIRRAPRLVEPGKTAALRINHATLAARTLRVALVDAAGTERASTSTLVPAGRFRATPVNVAIPVGLPDGTYSWRIELRPSAGGAALATINQPGVLIDQSVATPTLNTTDFPASHPRIQWQGRIQESGNSRIWHWYGSEIRLRFSGTSLAMTGSTVADIWGGHHSQNISVVVNDDFDNPLVVATRSDGSTTTIPLVSGLPDGIHTVRLYKSSETDRRHRFDAFRVDAGRGLLAFEPLPSRRMESYGDSVTSGSSASHPFWGYSILIGRELDTDFRNISKGGTGVAASFSGQAILVNYFNNLSFPDVFSASNGLKYDLTQWTPDIVTCGIGHNDQFNNGHLTFVSRYAEFKGLIRNAYPNVPFVSLNTVIAGSANLGFFQNATDPLTRDDPRHRFVYQPATWSDSNTIHPPTDAHIAMVYGDERRMSFADVVEDLAGWGLPAPEAPADTDYEAWALVNFTLAQRVAGVHAPAAAPFGDGVPNLLRFALGGTLTPGGSSAPAITLPSPATDNGGRLQLSFPRASADVIYVVETSGDLVTWQQAALYSGAAGGTTIWTDTVPAAPRRFARLRIVAP